MGLVVLSNRLCTRLMQAMGTNCVRALEGMPVERLSGDYGKRKADVLDPMRAMKRKFGALQTMWGWVRHRS